MPTPASPRLLLLAAASGVAGHLLVVTPALDALRGALRGQTVECLAAEPTDAMRDAPPHRADSPFTEGARALPFHLSSMEGRDVWRGEFLGRLRETPQGLAAELDRSRVTLTPEVAAGALRGLRLDLAEATPDGSWRVVAEGTPVQVGRRFRGGDVRAFPPMDLVLRGMGSADLEGRWLVVTMLASSDPGMAPLTHVHMPRGTAQGLAARLRAGAEAGRAILPGRLPPAWTPPR